MKEKLTKEEVGFTQIKNEVAQDSRLSWKARGLFTYIYSKPDNWDWSIERIAQDSPGGEKEVRTGIYELENFGYLTRKRLPNGKMNWHITFKPTAENRREAKPTAEKAYQPKSLPAQTGGIINKEDYTNKEIKKTKNCVSDETQGDISFISSNWIGQCCADQREHIRLIGNYMKIKKMDFPSKKTAEAELKRNLKTATLLKDYPAERRKKALMAAAKMTSQWTLETVLRYCNK